MSAFPFLTLSETSFRHGCFDCSMQLGALRNRTSLKKAIKNRILKRFQNAQIFATLNAESRICG